MSGISWEAVKIRSKANVRWAVQLAGVAIVLIGGYNMLATALLDLPVFAPYRVFGEPIIFDSSVARSTAPVVYLGDAILMAVGACVSWFL